VSDQTARATASFTPADLEDPETIAIVTLVGVRIGVYLEDCGTLQIALDTEDADRRVLLVELSIDGHAVHRHTLTDDSGDTAPEIPGDSDRTPRFPPLDHALHAVATAQFAYLRLITALNLITQSGRLGPETATATFTQRHVTGTIRLDNDDLVHCCVLHLSGVAHARADEIAAVGLGEDHAAFDGGCTLAGLPVGTTYTFEDTDDDSRRTYGSTSFTVEGEERAGLTLPDLTLARAAQILKTATRE